MDLLIAEARARIACRVYLKLFDAGGGFDGRDGGAIMVSDELDPPRADCGLDHVLVRDVLDRLERHQAFFRPDGSRPLFYRLDDTLRNRMSDQLGAMKPYADQIRSDLVKFDRGEKVPAGNWLDYEVRIRKGQLDREAL